MITQYCRIFYDEHTLNINGYISSGTPFQDFNGVPQIETIVREQAGIPVAAGTVPVQPVETTLAMKELDFEIDVDEEYKSFGVEQKYLNHDAIHNRVRITPDLKIEIEVNPKILAVRTRPCDEAAVNHRLVGFIEEKFNLKGVSKRDLLEMVSQARLQTISNLETGLSFTDLVELNNKADFL